jgi:hypothetical protein
MEDHEANYIWDKYSEFRNLFGTIEGLSQWLDEPGTCFESKCVRRRADGEWILGVHFSVHDSKRKLMLREGMILVERELWIYEQMILTEKRKDQFPVQKSTRKKSGRENEQ